MSYLVRKIAPAKWSGVRSLKDLSADALTADLRTTNNSLSLWEIDNEDELSNAVLALALSKRATKFEKMDLVLIPRETILAEQLPICASPGDTYAEELSDTHHEIVGLKYPSLGIFAKIIIDLLSKEAHKMFSKTDVEKIVKNAYNNKTIDISCLPKDIQEIIRK